MKRIVSLLVLIALIISMVIMSIVTALAETIPGSGYDENAYIKIGDYNDEVIALHTKLVELGYYSLRPESPWSVFSIKALRVLQENLDVPTTGIIENREQLDELLAVENVTGKNILLGTNQGTDNYSISQNGFESVLEAAEDGIGAKVTIIDKAADAGWLTLFYYDGWSKGRLVGAAGDEYTLSFEARSNVDGFNIRASHKQGNAKELQIDFGQVNVGTEWQSVTLNGTLTGTVEGSQGLYLDLRNNDAGTEVEIRNLKLEKGNRATEWVAAVED